jgi:hypothetical protein
MSDEKGRSGFTWAMWLAAFLPLAYVLSIGPVGRFVKATGGDPTPWRTVYYPLIWLHDNTLLAAPLDWYVRVWNAN